MDEPKVVKARRNYLCMYCGKSISKGSACRVTGLRRYHDGCWTLSRDPAAAPASFQQRDFVNDLIGGECPPITMDEASRLIDRMKKLRELGDKKANAEIQQIREAVSRAATAAELLAIPAIPREGNEYEGHFIEIDVRESDTMSHKESVHGVIRVREIASGKVVHEVRVAGSVSLLKRGGRTTGSIIEHARKRCRWWIDSRV